MPHSSVIIIGAGCAGLTSALYTARANLSPIVLDGFKPRGRVPGGQLMWTTDVENYPGFPQGVQGPELIELMRRQAERFGARFHHDNVVKIDLSRRPFHLVAKPDLEKRESVEYTCDGLIIAGGADARLLDLPHEMTFMGHGLSTCATCDGALYRGKVVGVVGGGDTAVEEATFLTRFASKVFLIHRRHELRASKIMQQRLLTNPKIEPLWNRTVAEYLGDHEPEAQLKAVRLASTTGEPDVTLELDGLFLAIGHSPTTDIYQGQVAMTPEGYLLNRLALCWKGVEAPAGLLDSMPNYGTATSVEGVFAAGDVVDTHYRQAVTAAGMGCMAAIDCEKWLEATRPHA
jgi:thioredoxin reductase (NADPH)